MSGRAAGRIAIQGNPSFSAAPFDIGDDGLDHLQWSGRALEFRKAVGDRVAGEMADPAFGDAEEADRVEVRLRTHFEPVVDVRRRVAQITLAADMAKHLAFGEIIEHA